MASCGPPARHGAAQRTRAVAVQALSSANESTYVELAGGWFDMGDAFGEGYPADGERPVHAVQVEPFAIAPTP